MVGYTLLAFVTAFVSEALVFNVHEEFVSRQVCKRVSPRLERVPKPLERVHFCCIVAFYG